MFACVTSKQRSEHQRAELCTFTAYLTRLVVLVPELLVEGLLLEV
jgi:hypothetical protein